MDGVFCPGGSLGNIMAISMARHRKWPECKKKGNSVIPSPVRIFTSETVSITTPLCMLNYSAIWLSTHRGDLINSFRLSTGTCSNKLSFPRRYHFRNLRFVLLTLTLFSWPCSHTQTYQWHTTQQNTDNDKSLKVLMLHKPVSEAPESPELLIGCGVLRNITLVSDWWTAARTWQCLVLNLWET